MLNLWPRRKPQVTTLLMSLPGLLPNVSAGEPKTWHGRYLKHTSVSKFQWIISLWNQGSHQKSAPISEVSEKGLIAKKKTSLSNLLLKSGLCQANLWELRDSKSLAIDENRTLSSIQGILMGEKNNQNQQLHNRYSELQQQLTGLL